MVIFEQSLHFLVFRHARDMISYFFWNSIQGWKALTIKFVQDIFAELCFTLIFLHNSVKSISLIKFYSICRKYLRKGVLPIHEAFKLLHVKFCFISKFHKPLHIVRISFLVSRTDEPENVLRDREICSDLQFWSWETAVSCLCLRCRVAAYSISILLSHYSNLTLQAATASRKFSLKT